MEIGDQRADVPAVLRLHHVGHVALEPANGRLHRPIPAPEVALVHAVVHADPRRHDPRMRQQELADGRIEREAVHALSRRVDQHRARAVHDVPRGDLLAARLEHVGHGAAAFHAHPAIDAEDGADRGVDVDVGGAVEGIEEHGVLADGVFGRDRDDLFVFFRAHHAHPAGVIEAVLDRLVGDDVELLLVFALHVLGAGGAEDVDQARPPDRRGDDLRRKGDVVEQVRQLAGGLGIAVFLIEDEPLDGRNGRLHEAPG